MMTGMACHTGSANPPKMKTALVSIGVTSLASLAFLIAGRPFDAADCAVCLMLSTLLAWTVEQYYHRSDRHT